MFLHFQWALPARSLETSHSLFRCPVHCSLLCSFKSTGTLIITISLMRSSHHACLVHFFYWDDLCTTDLNHKGYSGFPLSVWQPVCCVFGYFDTSLIFTQVFQVYWLHIVGCRWYGKTLQLHFPESVSDNSRELWRWLRTLVFKINQCLLKSLLNKGRNCCWKSKSREIRR